MANYMYQPDHWHYSRKELATQIMGMFESGLSSSFIFFAPRRMGKTEFLRKDIQPVAESKGWNVFYFSFLDAADHPTAKFKKALQQFIDSHGLLSKVKNAVKKLSKVSARVGNVSADLEFDQQSSVDIKELLGTLAKGQKTLLLMDEVQALAINNQNDNFIAGFRTALDMYKDNLKVIFTGSSQAGLRKMFSQVKAPFFHFGQNLAFPELDKGFTDHLAQVFKRVTCRELNTDQLWQAFIEMNKVPLLARSLVETLALNPGLTIAEAKNQLITEVFGNREFEEQWKILLPLERELLKKIASGDAQLFSLEARQELVLKLQREDVSAPTVQAAIKRLLRKGVIGKVGDRAGYFIDDPNFKNWLLNEAVVK